MPWLHKASIQECSEHNETQIKNINKIHYTKKQKADVTTKCYK